jgi:hypothetical protein
VHCCGSGKIKFISGFRVVFPEDLDPGFKDNNFTKLRFFDEKDFFSSWRISKLNIK